MNSRHRVSVERFLDRLTVIDSRDRPALFKPSNLAHPVPAAAGFRASFRFTRVCGDEYFHRANLCLVLGWQSARSGRNVPDHLLFAIVNRELFRFFFRRLRRRVQKIKQIEPAILFPKIRLFSHFGFFIENTLCLLYTSRCV